MSEIIIVHAILGINDRCSLEKCARRKDEWAEEREETAKHRGEDGGGGSIEATGFHPCGLLSLAVCEKNTVEANHYGGATTDHFTLTE